MNQEKEQNRKPRPSYRKLVIGLWTLFVVGILFIASLFAAISNGKLGYIPSFEELENPKNNFATEIYSADRVVLGTWFKENRSYVGYQDLSPHIIQALIATEDARFSSHSGIDLRGLGRVVLRTVLLGQDAGGGSTITQQLAKLLYHDPTRNFGKRVVQKLNEWVIAVKLERAYTKEELISMYLNKYDFNYHAVGIKSASQIYFNTTPKELTLEQAAMLVGMCKNSSYYNPRRRYELTLNRRNTVLDQMVKYNYLNPAIADSVRKLPIKLNFRPADHKKGLAPYFREYLRLTMTAKKPVRKNYASWQRQKFQEDSLEWNNNPLFGWCHKNNKPDGTPYSIYRDGLKIYTSIDSRMQNYAEEAVQEHLGGELQDLFLKEKKGRSYAPFTRNLTKKNIEAILKRSMRQTSRYRHLKRAKKTNKEILDNFNTPTKMKVFSYKGVIDTTMTPMDSIRYHKYFLRSGFMSMEPHTGLVRAYVGGPNYNYFMYDMVKTGKRQVGSTIKPFLYTLAMQEGFTPCDKVPNVAQTFLLPDGKTWTPKNSTDRRSGEMVTLKWGLANSVNWISAWVMKQFKPEPLAKMVHRLGITSHIDPVPSMFLGTSDISVAEMVAAYSVFVNKGVHIQPLFVTKIEDNNGNVLATFQPRKREVIDERTAYLMVNLLQGVVNHGTGRRLRFRYNLEGQIGGKTGTTQNHSDGWFMGITPKLVSGVWVGGEDRDVHFDGIRLGQGANMALPIFANYLQKVHKDSSLPYTEEDTFESPLNFNINLNCDEQPVTSSEENQTQSGDDDFFRE